MQLVLQLSMPEPGQTAERPAPLGVEDQVRDLLECIDSGHDSGVEWLTIMKLHKDLLLMKKTPRVVNLIRMIEPVLARYGYYTGAQPSSLTDRK